MSIQNEIKMLEMELRSAQNARKFLKQLGWEKSLRSTFKILDEGIDIIKITLKNLKSK